MSKSRDYRVFSNPSRQQGKTWFERMLRDYQLGVAAPPPAEITAVWLNEARYLPDLPPDRLRGLDPNRIWFTTQEDTMTFKIDNHALDIMARTIYGEAEGEPFKGQQAVAAVIITRAERGGWWGDNPVAVCLASKQFSCWNDDRGDIEDNRVKMLSVRSDDPMYQQCLLAAVGAAQSATPNPTEGATHYHHVDITPSWAGSPKMTKLNIIGRHQFWREEPGA